MFSLDDFAQPQPTVFQSHRFPDSAFGGNSAGHTDGATISCRDGEVISQWGEFSWKASSIGADTAAFEPVNAPSRFTWRRVDDATQEAQQRWSADGKPQEFTLRMTGMDSA